MTSALGFTAEHFAATRRTSGERAWCALYAGVAATPEGGLVKREWLDGWRLPSAPLGLLKTAAVDLAVDVGVSEVAVEGFAARETYRRVVNDALRRTKIDRLRHHLAI